MSIVNQFIEFVNSQPSDKEINNFSWETCAVGSFAEHIGKPFTEDEINTYHKLPNIDIFNTYRKVIFNPIISDLAEKFGSCRDSNVIAYKSINVDVKQYDDQTIYDNLNSGIYDTYGELQEDLKNYLTTN